MRRILALSLALLLLPSIPTSSSAAIKVGDNCTKIGKTALQSGAKYFCVKRNSRLIWSKGVAILPNPRAASSSSGDFFAGKECETVGTKITNIFGYLECREVANSKKKFFQLSVYPKAPPTYKSPEDISVCRISDQSKANRSEGPSIAYPVPTNTLYTTNPKVGQINAIIIPVDFPDSPGSGSPKELYDEIVEKSSAWMKWYTHGKSWYKFQTYDKWLRAPLNSSEYVYADFFTGPKNDPDIPSSFKTGRRIFETDIASEFLNLGAKYFDYEGMDNLFILYPRDIKNIWWGAAKLGNFQFSYGAEDPRSEIIIRDPRLLNVWISAVGAREYFYKYPLWTFFLHENLHNQGIQGHAPNQGSPLSMMSNQYGLSLPLTSWDTLIMDWQLDSEIYCVQKKSLEQTQIELSPLEREEIGTKSVMIKLSDSQILVIESRRKDKWSSGSATFPGLPDGFYGLVVYKVDTTKSAMYGVVEPDGADWKDQSDAFAYFIRNQNVSHGYQERAPGSGPFDLNFVIYEGETLITNGVEIKLERSGDHDLVRISKVS